MDTYHIWAFKVTYTRISNESQQISHLWFCNEEDYVDLTQPHNLFVVKTARKIASAVSSGNIAYQEDWWTALSYISRIANDASFYTTKNADVIYFLWYWRKTLF